MLTTNQKGAIAETAIAHHAVRLGIEVYKPIAEGGRYDLIFGLESALLRIQCKWAALRGDVVVVECRTCRRGPEGFIRRLYTADEIDAFAAYCMDVDRCFMLPIARFPAPSAIQLRLGPTRNNQQAGVNWADDYDLVRLDLDGTFARGAIAQLGERLTGSQKGAGSSPAGST
jgi:PD-(D/E)XK endonuclease